jgi:hypothetical protein
MRDDDAASPTTVGAAPSPTRRTTMPTTQPNEQQKNLEQHKRQTMNTLIEAQVIQALGAPHDLLKVWVRPLWENTYRVNVLTGTDITCAKIANSFFLATDADGTIKTCSPQIKKQYESQ